MLPCIWSLFQVINFKLSELVQFRPFKTSPNIQAHWGVITIFVWFWTVCSHSATLNNDLLKGESFKI